LVRFLGREYGSGSKKSPLLPALAANLLERAFRGVTTDWPIEFVSVYISDALDARLWVDHDQCRLFVDNVITVFAPPYHDNDTPTGVTSGSGSSSDEKRVSVVGEPPARCRYFDDGVRNAARQLVEVQVKAAISNASPHQHQQIVNGMRLLELSCQCSDDLRHFAARHMESWLSGTQTSLRARLLLQRLVTLITSTSSHDMEAVTLLLRLRVRPQAGDAYITAIARLVSNNSVYWRIGISEYMRSDPSSITHSTSAVPPSRMLEAVLKAPPYEGVAVSLASYIHSVLQSREYNGRILAIIRRVCASPRDYHFTLDAFTTSLLSHQLLSDTSSAIARETDETRLEILVLDIVNILVFAVMVSATPVLDMQVCISLPVYPRDCFKRSS
jgi:hypothetical protein